MPTTNLTLAADALDAAEAAICAALREEPVRPGDPDAFVRLALAEGVVPLLWRSATLPELPDPCVQLLREEVRQQLALASAREPHLRQLLAAFAEAGVDVLVIKGAHLAYSVYTDPALRPRNDTDLLVRPSHQKRARRVLESLGYRRQPAITGVAVQGQTIFDREDAPGCVLDVHERLAAPIVAAGIFDFSRLWNQSLPVPALGPMARGPDPLDAIAIAAIHLAAHHPNERGLLWLFDLHLLTRTLGESDIIRLARMARERRISSLVATVLSRMHTRFPTPAAAALVAALPFDASEPSVALLQDRPPAEQALLDVKALRSNRARAAYIAGHLFPPADYMRRRYAPGSRAPLAWLYVARMAAGAAKWCRGYLSGSGRSTRGL